MNELRVSETKLKLQSLQYAYRITNETRLRLLYLFHEFQLELDHDWKWNNEKCGGTVDRKNRPPIFQEWMESMDILKRWKICGRQVRQHCSRNRRSWSSEARPGCVEKSNTIIVMESRRKEGAVNATISVLKTGTTRRNSQKMAPRSGCSDVAAMLVAYPPPKLFRPFCAFLCDCLPVKYPVHVDNPLVKNNARNQVREPWGHANISRLQ